MIRLRDFYSYWFLSRAALVFSLLGLLSLSSDANEIDEADQIWFLRRHLKKIILEIIVFIFHPFWLPNNRINFFSAEKHPFLDSLYFFMFFKLICKLNQNIIN